MTSQEIRRQFIDFFVQKHGHTFVPSSPVVPHDDPTLLFTNAGMNQFKPIFLATEKRNYVRAVNTQKCIRAGGKHNDLDDVGRSRRHHTFFEMLGNWSFGDYFKREAIEWAWELVVERWKLPPQRLYATVYQPGPGDPSEFDQEAHDHWARMFQKAGLDPAIHIVDGNKKDNFWMMGDTGPCGPCSELHVDLTPAGDTRGSLVNAGDARCIEIWNLVFIQFNANPDGTFVPLPARHVDTGMGFERITSMIQGTKNWTDFTGTISNYETDVFRPIFDEIEQLSGKTYRSTLPVSGSGAATPPQADSTEMREPSLARRTDPAARWNDSTARSEDSTARPESSAGPENLSAGDRRGASDASGAVPHTVESSGGVAESSHHPDKSSDRAPESSERAAGSSHCGEKSSQESQIQTDIAFRVIADHIRTLSFAIADGIQPSNEGRGYVLRRILRRAVRYGRTLGFHEPFFFKLTDVLVSTMGDVFPELREKQQLVRDTIRREEESFNRTIDNGIELFEREVGRLSGRVGVSPAGSGILPGRTSNVAEAANYTRRRRLPHFEQPWASYALTISTDARRKLRPESRTIVLDALRHFDNSRYDLIAACVMPDHVHAIIRPWVKEQNEKGEAVFWSLGELMHSIKSFTAKEINKADGTTGSVWEQERFDRYVRGDRDLEEKFRYIVTNPEREGLGTEYPWVWTQEDRSGKMPKPAGETPTLPEMGPSQGNVISGDFAFRLYDEQGFPLDLTELMARERGLTVDVAGFEKLMDEQRDRARKAQKKTVISVEDGKLDVAPTKFLGYDFVETEAVVEAVLPGRSAHELNIVLDRTALYAEMGGQVGDRGLLHVPGHDRTEVGQLTISDTQKRGDVFVHISKLREGRAPEPGEAVRVAVDVARRNPIQRHHTVTHLLHWALHEVVSKDAVQKGSYVGPEKLTFDFSSAALTPQQVRDVEKLVNERIAEDAPVSWTEIPYAEAKQRSDITQFFGDKYGDVVRVVQIGGKANELNGYSMELCGGTHVRNTGDIQFFKIVSEGAIAAGIRRIEAVAGAEVMTWAKRESAKHDEKFAALSRKKALSPLGTFAKSDAAAAVSSVEERATQLKKLETEVQEWEKQQAKAAEAELKNRAATIADGIARDYTGGAVVAELPDADGALLQAVVDRLKTKLQVPILLAGTANGRVDIVASVPSTMTEKLRANDLVQQVAMLLGGKGGGRPDNARGSGKDVSKLPDALAKARELMRA
jgi:alanyl-tRNA synthetase/REP element-mobilizing transposase RayT